MSTYNGHRNYNYWNVALWIGNDEGIYRLALECRREAKRKGYGVRSAALAFIENIGADKTPDGVPYRVSYVIAALRGLE